MLSACGQVGPLYMPRVPADPDAGPAAAAASQQQEQQRQQQRQRMPLPGSNTSNMPPTYMQNPVSPQQY
jgi:predicted small lipoprotein YifL